MTRVEELRAEQARRRKVLEAYALVFADLAPHLSPHSITLHTFQFHRQQLYAEVESFDHRVAAEQEKCTHALELIGDARPPVWRCVHCQLVRPCLG